jgi:serine/threonine-protein kinase
VGVRVRTDEEPDSLIGSVIAERYLVLEPLGEGGMARVYRGRHLGLDKRVAIKVLAPKVDVPDAAARFLREARSMADIDHPNVVRVTDFGVVPGGPLYLVMEHVEGEDLGTTLANVGRMPWSRVRHIVLQVARGLGSAHARGIVHRDVKPDNILRVADRGDADFVKVIDFGIARAPAGGMPGITRTGAVFGTPEYMAPEQGRSTKVDQRVDVYALGIVAYELVTGGAPFSGDDFMEVLWRHASEPLVAPSQVVEGVDPDADAFVSRACAKDPADRFQTMDELVAFVERDGREARRSTDVVVAPRRTWVPVVVLSALVLAGVAASWAIAVVGDGSSSASPLTGAAPPVGAAPTAEPAPARADHAVSPTVEPTPQLPAVEPAAEEESVPEDEAPPSNAGQLSARTRSKVLRKAQPGISACVGGIMGGKPNERVAVRFVVAGNGRIQSARAVGPHAGTALGKCVVAAARAAEFPTFSAKNATFTYTFEL